MSIKGSVDISNPAGYQLKVMQAFADGLTILSSTNWKDLAAQANTAMALTQPEMAARDAAVKAETDAKVSLAALQVQYSALKQEISDAQSQADASNLADKAASDLYVKTSNQTISDKWKALNTYSKELDSREIEAADRETAATAAETKNANDAAANSAQKAALNKFAAALAEFAPGIPILEQPATE